MAARRGQLTLLRLRLRDLRLERFPLRDQLLDLAVERGALLAPADRSRRAASADRTPDPRRARRSPSCAPRRPRCAASTLSRRAGSAAMRLRSPLLLLPRQALVGRLAPWRDLRRLRLEHRVGVEVIVAAALRGTRRRCRGSRAGPSGVTSRMRVASSETNQRSCETKSTRALERAQPLDERLDGLEVEVVGRLVEHQHVGLLDDDAAEDEPRRLAAGERRRSASRTSSPEKSTRPSCPRTKAVASAGHDVPDEVERRHLVVLRAPRGDPARSSRRAPRAPSSTVAGVGVDVVR